MILSANSLLFAQIRDRFSPDHALRIGAQQQLVPAHLPAFQPVEETHAQQISPQRAGLRDQRRNRPFHNIADRDAVERDRRDALDRVRERVVAEEAAA